jgi:Domain of unknown function (DU1801)
MLRLPQTVEVVWRRQRAVGWGRPQELAEQFAYCAIPAARHLGFYHGGEQSDPRGLLPEVDGREVGGSLTMRSLRITSLEQVRYPALRTLVEAATITGVPPIRNR